MLFHHIGIFVSSIPSGRNYFNKIIKIKKKSKIILDKNLKVKIQFLYDEKNICYELVAGYGKKNPVEGTLKKKDNILNHVAYKAKHFDSTIKLLNAQGNLQISSPQNAKAFKNKRVVFFLTKLNFILEIIEE